MNGITTNSGDKIFKRLLSWKLPKMNYGIALRRKKWLVAHQATAGSLMLVLSGNYIPVITNSKLETAFSFFDGCSVKYSNKYYRYAVSLFFK